MMKAYVQFLPLDALAGVLGLPRAWVRAQADAGAIPSIKIGSRRIFDVDSVRDAVLRFADDTEKSDSLGNYSD